MSYDELITLELRLWQEKMKRPPSVANRLSKSLQDRFNRVLPAKVQKGIAAAVKGMVRGVLFGARHTTGDPGPVQPLLDTEMRVKEVIKGYRNTAAAEGGITGAGGLLLGLADFPLLLGIKMKMLFEIARMYGYSVDDYKERLFLLHVFSLAFSSAGYRRQVYEGIEDWDRKKESLPEDIRQFDWQNFQQEYRDYIDLAKLAQLIPGIGAVVGVVVNYRLIEKLGTTAMNAYRMRRKVGL